MVCTICWLKRLDRDRHMPKALLLIPISLGGFPFQHSRYFNRLIKNKKLQMKGVAIVSTATYFGFKLATY